MFNIEKQNFMGTKRYLMSSFRFGKRSTHWNIKMYNDIVIISLEQRKFYI